MLMQTKPGLGQGRDRRLRMPQSEKPGLGQGLGQGLTPTRLPTPGSHFNYNVATNGNGGQEAPTCGVKARLPAPRLPGSYNAGIHGNGGQA